MLAAGTGPEGPGPLITYLTTGRLAARLRIPELGLRRALGERWERVSLTAEPRSAYLLRGPSRTEWEHSIPAVDALRYSITFRNLRED